MRGCYGLQILGVPGADRYLADLPPSAPSLEIRRHRGDGRDVGYDLSVTHAVLPLSDGGSVAELTHGSGYVDLTLCRDYSDEALLHPLLSGSLAVTNWWHGRDAFHAGAFVVDRQAWVVLGDKGQGKSSLLAHLALHGVPVLSDDVIVIDGDDVLAGPAFVDLRPDAAAHLGAGRDLGRLGARERFRLDIDVPPARMPLAGWVQLAWGTEVALRPVPVAHRLQRLFHNRAVLLDAASPAAFVRHAARPFHELTRPKDWNSLPVVTDTLATLQAPSPPQGREPGAL